AAELALHGIDSGKVFLGTDIVCHKAKVQAHQVCGAAPNNFWTAWRRVCIPSFGKMRFRKALTVHVSICMRWPISLSERPSLTSLIVSHSRGVRFAGAGSGVSWASKGSRFVSAFAITNLTQHRGSAHFGSA